MNDGLLLLRVVTALILYVHSTQKLLGWFHGPGLTASETIFTGLGQTPARPLVVLAATCEMSAAILLAAGLLTPVGAAIGAGTMLGAAGSVTARAKRLWNSAGGGEYPLFLAFTMIAIGFTGPGRYAIDRPLGVTWYSGDHFAAYWVGVAVAVVAVIAAAGPVARAQRKFRSAASASGTGK